MEKPNLEFSKELLERFYSASFWKAMDFHSERNRDIREMLQSGDAGSILYFVANGFVPLCDISPKCFDVIARFSPSPRGREIAAEIRDIELGLHPLIPSGDSSFIHSHSQQFLQMLSSLAGGREFEVAPVFRQRLEKAVDLQHVESHLLRALAMAFVIEHTGTRMPHYFGNLVSMCAVVRKINFSNLRLQYLYEHGLTEVNAHTSLVNELICLHPGVAESQAFLVEQERFVEANYQHFEHSWL